MKIAMTVEYDGAPFFGFQRQKNEITVQSELERVLEIVLRGQTRVLCAGRTDTGVSALGQVVHFSSGYDKGLDRLIYALNSLLPHTISIRHAATVPENFHARFSCLAREYVYVIYNAPYRPTSLGLKSLWVRDELNWDRVREALPSLIGENNFAAFTRVALVQRGEPTTRRIDDIRVIEEGRSVFIYFRGSGFLHNMIRILVGTLLDVARGEFEPEAVAKIIASGDRLEAGVTMKPHALYFLHAEYADYDQSAAQHDMRRQLIG